MAILVTGGAGYVGSHVAYEVVDASRDVIVLDNLSTGFAREVPSSARLVIGDIADEAPAGCGRRSVHQLASSQTRPLRPRQTREAIE
jgi:nucleoside-diphosphate-sugar epimerase